MISAALVVAGSSTLVVDTIALRHVEYPSVYSLNSALLDELSISQSTVVQHIRQHPEELFASQFAEQPLPDGRTVGEVARTIQQRPMDDALASARRWSFVGLAAVLVGAVGAAWVLAGSILRPIRRMTVRARSASVSDLGTRVSAGGPNDEIRELADTFDSMLDRLALAFDAQRRFASQVAHELRTPLATTRTEIAMLLDDTTDRDTVRRLEAVRDAVDRGERLVARLLVLSRVDLRALEKSRFALDELVGNVLGRVVEGPAFARLRVDVDLRTTEVACDRALVESLVQNLLDNSARHNRAADGWVRVEVAPDPESGTARLVVANSVAAPTESFSRPPGQDAGPAPSPPGGASGPGEADSDAPSRPGTGLSIVNAVLRAHGGAIAWTRCPGEVTAHITIPAVRATEVAVVTRLPGRGPGGGSGVFGLATGQAGRHREAGRRGSRTAGAGADLRPGAATAAGRTRHRSGCVHGCRQPAPHRMHQQERGLPVGRLPAGRRLCHSPGLLRRRTRRARPREHLQRRSVDHRADRREDLPQRGRLEVRDLRGACGERGRHQRGEGLPPAVP